MQRAFRRQILRDVPPLATGAEHIQQAVDQLALILLPLYLLSVRKKGLGMGGGDVKLIVVLALVLGRGDRALGALLLASLIGLIQIIALSIKNRHFLTQIPFGPALIVGSLLAL